MKKKLFPIAIAVLLTFGATQCNNKPANQPADQTTQEATSPDDLAKILDDAAQEVQSSLPLQINANTQLTACNVKDGHILQYTYKGTSLSKAQFDSVAFKEKNQKSLIDALKGNFQTKVFIEKGASFMYTYEDKDNNYLCRMLFTPDELK